MPSAAERMAQLEQLITERHRLEDERARREAEQLAELVELARLEEEENRRVEEQRRSEAEEKRQAEELWVAQGERRSRVAEEGGGNEVGSGRHRDARRGGICRKFGGT